MIDHPVWQVPMLGWQVIQASAGTGKTWTMAGLFARAVMETSTPIKSILALTFTRAATEELKRRITTQLQELRVVLSQEAADSEAENQTETQGIFAETARSVYWGRSSQEREQALERIELALANLDSMAVYTLHGFGQRMLRLYAARLGQPVEQSIATDATAWLRPALDKFWRHLLSGKAELASVLLARDISPVSHLRQWESSLSFPTLEVRAPEQSTMQLTERVVQARHALNSVPHQRWRELGQWLTEQTWDKRHWKTKRTGVTHSARLADWIHSDALVPDKPMLESFEKFTRQHIEHALKGKAELPDIREIALCSEFYAASQALDSLIPAIAYELRIWCEQHLPEMKRALRVQTHDDALIHLARALTSDASSSLASDIAARFPICFMDESQDTDAVPWQIFERIYGPARVEKSASLAVSSTSSAAKALIAVGDPKQSIYRFRGADVHEFVAVATGADGRFRLEANYRSDSDLIHAVNALFATPNCFRVPGLEFFPATVAPSASNDRAVKHPLKIVWLGEDLPKGQLQALATEQATAQVQAYLSNGYAAGDIALLVGNHQEAKMLTSALNKVGVACINRSRDKVFLSHEASDFMAIVSSLEQPGNMEQMRAAAATRLVGFTAGEILDSQRLEFLKTVWRQTLADLEFIGIVGALRRLLISVGCYQRLASLRSGERRITNVNHLLMALHKADPVPRGIRETLQWLARARSGELDSEEQELLLENDLNLVQISTIHASKGLQYPIVIMPFAWSGTKERKMWDAAYRDHGDRSEAVNSDGAILDFRWPLPKHVEERRRNDELAERIRLFYVATTRAERSLTLYAAKLKHASKNVETTEPTEQSLSGMQLCLGKNQEDYRALADANAQKISFSLFGDCAAEQAIALVQPARQSKNLALLETTESVHWSVSKLPVVADPWLLSSYTSLVRGLSVQHRQGQSMLVRDVEQSISTHVVAPESTSIRDTLTGGAKAGVALHALFETLDLTKSVSLQQIEQWNKDYRLLGGLPDSNKLEAMRLWVDGVRACRVAGRALSELSRENCRNEMEFFLSCADNSARFVQALESVSLGPIQHPTISRGLMHGFIDLVFESDGRYHVLDWKSNYLGRDIDSYQDCAMREAMIDHRYDWQAAFYLLAVHRWLRTILPEYDPAKHLGSAWYVFLRGAGDPARAIGSGMFEYRLSLNDLLRLDKAMQ